MKKKIFIVTSSRADYSPLKNLINLFKNSKYFDTYLIVTGQHLHKKSGNTLKEITKTNKLKIRKIKLNYKNFNVEDISDYMMLIMKSFSKLLKKIRPKLIIVLGDRYEILSCSISSNQFNIPIAHLHGGEITKGSLDNVYRDIITLLSKFHFVCHEKYKNRIIKMGINSKKIFNFGAPGLEFNHYITDNIPKKITNFISTKKTFIVTYHPNTIDPEKTSKEIRNLLLALKKFKKYNFIITYPNLDVSNAEIVKKITIFSKNKDNILIVKSLGKKIYFNILNRIDGLIGNSSSSILESSSFKIPCLNIGNRQDGRIITKNIYNCSFNLNDIIKGIHKINSMNFKSKIKNIKNPFYKKNTNLNIFKKIKKLI